jgi:CobQ/CobB/MinD/ParA nucleotide binding domain.
MGQHEPAAEFVSQETVINGTNKNGTRQIQANSIHLSLQGKGGVGKSLVASILAQYFRARGRAVRCIDTDPVNRTLFQYKALDVSRLELLREGSIDQRGFDSLMETLLTEDATFIVDNGASTFIPLWSYILENSAVDVLTRAGKQLYVHTIITGGQALLDTLHGFKSLAESTSERNIIVWLNEYFGRIERDGKSFEDMGAYRESEGKVFGSVHLTKRNQDTFGRDLEEVISRKFTLEEAIKDGPFSIMTKQLEGHATRLVRTDRPARSVLRALE